MENKATRIALYLLSIILAVVAVNFVWRPINPAWKWFLAGIMLFSLLSIILLTYRLTANKIFISGILILAALAARLFIHLNYTDRSLQALMDLACGIFLIIALIINWQSFLAGDQYTPKKCLDNILDSLPYGLLMVDLQGVVTFANKILSQIFGYGRDEIVGAFVWDLPLMEKERIMSFFQNLPDKYPAPYTYNFQNRTKQGRLLDLQVDWDYQKNNKEEIIGIVVIISDITARKDNEEKFRYLCFHDSLTGLYNRAFFEAELKRLDVERQLPISIISGDVNYLKVTNDAFGHSEGDRLLVNVANILKSVCRHEDVISRWGGDEFVILLPKTGQQEAKKICHRIKAACEEFPTQIIPFGIALGYATKSDPGTDIIQAIKEAESMMYKNKLAEDRSLSGHILRAMENKLRKTCEYSPERINKVKDLALKFGQELGLDETKMDNLILLCRFHDLGNIGIEKDIMQKSSPLTTEEWASIKKHPEIGYHIARSSKELLVIAEEVLAHHEHWDGSGYPRGIKGEEIPYLARIFAIVDAYVAMTDSKGYKKPISPEAALEEIKRSAGSHFDPALAEVFVKMMKTSPESLPL